MPEILDIFKTDAFGLVALTDAIQKLPYKPFRIGGMGLFEPQGIPTTTLALEERSGILALLPTRLRGENAPALRRPKRKVRSFAIPHIPHDDTILAAELQNVRAFGSETTAEIVASVVNDHLAQMRANHEVTLEYHRMGAVHGVILDADGATTIYNLFTEFGVSEQVVNFALTTDSTSVRAKCLAVARAIESALGAIPYTGIHAFCGATFFEQLIDHPSVADAYHRFQDSVNLRNDPRAGFEFGGIVFEEYRGKLGDVDYINAAHARFFPQGVPGLFKTYYAPADFVETVNTLGQPLYAKQELMKFGKGVELHTQQNPLCLCLRPRVLIKGTNA